MKNNRIPCPFCAEEILPQAKKCRYCGEIFVKNAKKSVSMRFLYWAWVSSIIFFLLSFHFLRRSSINDNSWMVIIIVTMLSGFFIFLLLTFEILISLRKKKTQLYGLASLLTFILFFVLFSQYEVIEAALGFPPIEAQRNINVPPQMNTVLPTTQPKSKSVISNTLTAPENKSDQITCTGPDSKTFKTTQIECDDFNNAWNNNNSESMNTDNTGGSTNSQYFDQYLQDLDSKTISNQKLYEADKQIKAEATAQAVELEAQLETKQKQECLQRASTTYQSDLRSCDSQYSYFQGDSLYEGCKSSAYQQYVKNKGSCN
jgi:hypothetical protein